MGMGSVRDGPLGRNVETRRSCGSGYWTRGSGTGKSKGALNSELSGPFYRCKIRCAQDRTVLFLLGELVEHRNRGSFFWWKSS